MAGISKDAFRLTPRGLAAGLLMLLAFGVPASAEPTMSLADAAARKPPDFTPLHDDQVVTVTGQVSITPIRISTFYHLAIQERGNGLVLEAGPGVFDRLSPGDWVEAQGRISKRAGLPV